jgi:hypothetical protein
MTSAAKLSSDPSNVDFRPATSSDHLDPVFHHYGDDDGIDVVHLSESVDDAGRFTTEPIAGAGCDENFAPLQVMYVAMLQEIVHECHGIGIQRTAKHIRDDR